jgi:hypothetical protein
MRTTIQNPTTMKKKLLVLSVLLLAGLTHAQLTFTDPVFKSYLLSSTASNNIAMNAANQSIKIDANSSGEIEVAEAAVVDRLWIDDVNITSIGGVEGFTNLRQADFMGLGITTVSFPPAFGLEKLQIDGCGQLTSVNLSGLNQLTQVTCTDDFILSSINLTGCTSLATLAIQSTNLESLDVSGNTSILNMYLDNNELTTINVSGCTSLNGLNVNGNLLTSLDVSGLTNLGSLNVGVNPALISLNASGCTNLSQLNANGLISMPALSSLNLTNCASLPVLSLTGNLTSLFITGCSSLVSVDLQWHTIDSVDLTGCDALQFFTSANGGLQTLNLGNAPLLTTVSAMNNLISSVSNIGPNVTSINLASNQLVTIDASNHPALAFLSLLDNPLINVNVSGCTNLQNIGVTTINSNIQNLNIANCPLITSFGITGSNFQSINVQGCTGLTFLSIACDITADTCNVASLDLSGLSNLQTLHARNLNLGAINLTGCSALNGVLLDDNNLTSVDLVDCVNMTSIDLQKNQLTTADLSHLSSLVTANLEGNASLVTVYAKNGRAESLLFDFFNSSLVFVCQDEETVTTTQAELDSNLLTAVCNSYCAFTPGGDYNTITGNTTFDDDNDGCDPADLPQTNVRIDFTDGITNSATFSNFSGQYTMYAGAGNFALMPTIENAAVFTISPATAVIPFANDDNNTVTQHFCISANGIAEDAEVVIAPIVPARPGFDAWYSITIKNKGNQTLSGNYFFVYNDDLMDFVIATQPVSEQSTGQLTWSYDNLLPFESRSVYVNLNINSPVETPAVNLDDILTFWGYVDPTETDINPDDNEFEFNQTVVGSYDPNDITCIEGDVAPPSEIGEYLHYVVNFENTGTAPAENVVVRLAIDPNKYNIDTLQLLNTSHLCRATLTGNIAEFIFEGIQLGTESTPPVGGHGNVLFKIKSNDVLNEGDSVTSMAKIYFDYNAPIDTNDAETVFQLLGNPGHPIDQSVTVYPNPASTTLYIRSSFDIESVALYDVQGRILENNMTHGENVAVDVSGKPNGIYFVKVTTVKGIKVEKIIKE